MTTPARDPQVADLLVAVFAAFDAGRPDPAISPCLGRIRTALASRVGPTRAATDRTDVAALVSVGLAPALDRGGALGRLAERIGALSHRLPWRLRGGPDPAAATIANAMILGPKGLEDRRDIWIGLSLVPPGVTYPEHRHPPEEVYLFLTGGTFRHGDLARVTPGIGGLIHNPPGITHTMQAPPDGPLLAVWGLWIGEEAG